MALASWTEPGRGSQAHSRCPVRLTSTCRFIPVRLCLPDHRQGSLFQLQQGRSVPSMMYRPVRGTCSAAASSGPRTPVMIRVTTAIVREIVGWEAP